MVLQNLFLKKSKKIVSDRAYIEFIISSKSAPYITKYGRQSGIEQFFQRPGQCPPRRTRTGILSRAATTLRLLPGKLHSRITRCINRPSGNEASGVRGTEETRQTRQEDTACHVYSQAKLKKPLMILLKKKKIK